MKRPLINYILDSLAFLLVVFLLLTGLLMGFTLPAGSGRAMVLGLSRHEWGEIHLWGALLFMAVIVVHLLLHWRWIVSMTTGKVRGWKRTARLAALGVVLVMALGGSIGVLYLPVTDAAPRQENRRGEAVAQEDRQETADSQQRLRGRDRR
ncbi:MAG: DUF4405 domain-containing protein [Candidatus Sumerlaeia bacterium]|nr:DUF4405 domain-containing protein [Candidatus Sumerlaeia bacterium]